MTHTVPDSDFMGPGTLAKIGAPVYLNRIFELKWKRKNGRKTENDYCMKFN